MHKTIWICHAKAYRLIIYKHEKKYKKWTQSENINLKTMVLKYTLSLRFYLKKFWSVIYFSNSPIFWFYYYYYFIFNSPIFN